MAWGDFPGPNPTKRIQPYRVNKKVREISPGQLQKVMAEIKRISGDPKYTSLNTKSYYTLSLFVLNTGLRRSELLGLKWKDIRGSQALIHGKGDITRSVPLNATALKIIKQQPKKDEYVFQVIGRKENHNIYTRLNNKIKENTGISFSFHLLRHEFATQLIAKGIDIITVAEILGHSHMSMTAIYSHTTKERKAAAVRALDTKADT